LFSCELEGSRASLLGTGVTLFTADFLNAGFFTEGFGFAIALTFSEVSLAFSTPFEDAFEGVGVAEGVLVKKLWIVRCCEELEAFFCDDGWALAGVASSCLTMVVNVFCQPTG
jgi:hypothetical protein